MIRIVYKVRESLKKFNIDAPVCTDEPLSRHTSFRIGGPADVYVAPRSLEEVRQIHALCVREHVPRFILGAGANILVADRGIRGLVIDLGGLAGIHREGNTVEAMAGTPMARLADVAVEIGLAGLEPFTAMPGSVGGSLWMNARCYGVSIADVLAFADILDEKGNERRLPCRKEEFSYKRSPFQSMSALILRGGFRLRRGDYAGLRAEADARRADRERKGHFLHPCAGSAFKNNPAFGAPTGRIVDSLGLRGFSIGGAAVSERHANIVVNRGGATARDVRSLIEHVKARVHERYGFDLEEEILYVGDWAPGDGHPGDRHAGDRHADDRGPDGISDRPAPPPGRA